MKVSDVEDISVLLSRNSELLPANFRFYNIRNNTDKPKSDFKIFVKSTIYKSTKVYPFSPNKPISKLFSLKSIE